MPRTLQSTRVSDVTMNMNRSLRVLARLAAVLMATGTAASTCTFSSGDDDDTPPAGVVFHFKMHGDVSGVQDFRAMTADPLILAAARAQLDKPVHERELFIIGPIERGDGGHNLVWRWHFVPDAWSLTEVAIELCDGNAVMVDQAVDFWVDVVGSFCPWGSYVATEIGPAD